MFGLVDVWLLMGVACVVHIADSEAVGSPT